MKKRLISRLDIKGRNVIKGIQLEGLRIVGEVGSICRERYRQGYDEVLILDSVASLYGRDALLEAILRATESVFIPVTAGGGIRALGDATTYFRYGADRIAINSAALENPNILSQVAEVYGAQAVVSSVEAKKVDNNRWHCFFESGREDSQIEVGDWIKSLSSQEVGEVLVTSVDMDGTMRGPDLDLVKKIANVTDIPIVYSGGLVTADQVMRVLEVDVVAGVVFGAASHYGKLELFELKKELAARNFSVRQE